MIKPQYNLPKKIALLLFIPLLFTLSGCGSETEESSDRITVFVSIEPQRFFLNKIGGDYINVEVMVKPGQNPATYEPAPVQITKLGKSKVFFTIGVPFENSFINKIESTLPELNIVDTAEGISKRKIEDHSHDSSAGDQESELSDPHVWMSPVLVKKQASIILNTLVGLAPEKSDYFRQNYNNFIRELDQLNTDIEKILKPLKGRIMFVYHPSFGYFTDQYGLRQEAIESGGKEPSPRILESIIEEIIENGVDAIFVQPEFRNSSIEVISEATGASVIPVDPLSYNYFENLKYIAETLGAKLREE